MWVADLADLERAEQVALEAWDAGPIDILVNNAAIPKRRPITGLSAEEVERVMTVNFFAPVRMTLALLPRMLARASGTIVNVSSMGGRMGIIHEAAYSASKFALCGWSESMAIDLHGTGVSVKLIQPGPVDTEIWDQADNEPPLYQGPKIAPEEVADGILTALSSDRFEHYLPDLKAIVDGKQADVDAFIVGSARMAG
jgi:short-subunit dehydrogenase